MHNKTAWLLRDLNEIIGYSTASLFMKTLYYEQRVEPIRFALPDLPNLVSGSAVILKATRWLDSRDLTLGPLLTIPHHP